MKQHSFFIAAVLVALLQAAVFGEVTYMAVNSGASVSN
jgi:hypothetical protein